MLEETGCDAVMIGRGVLGNPWLIKECVDYLEIGTLPQEVSFLEKVDMMKKHYELLLKDKTEKQALLEIRSHIIWYLKGMPKSKEIKNILLGDILSGNISDEDVREFVNPNYYENFIRERKNKNDFFTDRESAVLFGIPSNFIEGILVGRKYETDSTMLNKIKELVPNAYICNLD